MATLPVTQVLLSHKVAHCWWSLVVASAHRRSRCALHLGACANWLHAASPLAIYGWFVALTHEISTRNGRGKKTHWTELYMGLRRLWHFGKEIDRRAWEK